MPRFLIATPNYNRPDLLRRTAESFVRLYGSPADGDYRWVLIDDDSDAETCQTINAIQAELGCWFQVVNTTGTRAVMACFNLLYANQPEPYRVYMESDYEWLLPGWLDYAADILQADPRVGEVLTEHLPGVLARNEAAGHFVSAEEAQPHPYLRTWTPGFWCNRFGQFSMRVHMARPGLLRELRPFPHIRNRGMEPHIGRYFHSLGWQVAHPLQTYADHIGKGNPAVPYANMGGNPR